MNMFPGPEIVHTIVLKETRFKIAEPLDVVCITYSLLPQENGRQ